MNSDDQTEKDAAPLSYAPQEKSTSNSSEIVQTDALTSNNLPLPFFKLLALLIGVSLVTYAVYYVSIPVVSLVAVYGSSLVCTLAGAPLLRFVGKLPKLPSIFIPALSIILMTSINGFGLHEGANVILLVLKDIGVLLLAFIINALLFLLLSKKPFVQFVLFIFLVYGYFGLGSVLFVRSSHKEQAQSLETLTFELYKPSILPQNYKIEYVQAQSNPYGRSDIPHVTISFKGLGSLPDFDLNEFATYASFKPPINCGNSLAILSDADSGCTFIGRATSGCDVYREIPVNSMSDYAVNQQVNKGLTDEQIVEKYHSAAFCQIKGTILTLGLYPELTNREVIAFFDTIVRTDAGTLKQDL